MGVRRALALAVVAALSASALTSCGHHQTTGASAQQWRSARVPAPPGRRPILQSAVWCGTRWYAVGATADARGATRPAVWTSTDALRWRPVALDPGHDYYARRAILTSVGCSRGRVAALGAKPGGAHGNPRVETWHQLADGTLAAVPAPFERYGGQDAVSVNRLCGGTAGFLVTGTRVSGAAVWSSPTGARFTLHARAPGLASSPAASTQALDAVWWDGAWVVVGDASRSDGRLVATAWSGTGRGPWRAVSLPGGAHLTTGERVVLTGAGPVAVGLLDRAFGIWSDRDGNWSQESTFGAQVEATSPVFVSGLAWTGSRFAVTYGDGDDFRLAVGTAASLAGVPLPTTVTDRGDHTATVAAHGDDLLLLTDDGHHTHAWLTHLDA